MEFINGDHKVACSKPIYNIGSISIFVHHTFSIHLVQSEGGRGFVMQKKNIQLKHPI